MLGYRNTTDVIVITMAQAKARGMQHSLLTLGMAECIVVATKGSRC